MHSNTRRMTAPVLVTLALAALLGGVGVAQAQDTGNHKDGAHRDSDLQLGLALGLVDAEDVQDAEIYGSVSLRFRIGQHNEDPVWDGDNYHGRPPADSGIRGYLEPEIGYWSASGDNADDKDLLVGMNLIGVVPTRNADYFFGVGFGVHFFDGTLTVVDAGQRIEQDLGDERLGGNLQAGVDVNISEGLALFGVGRLDILEGDRAERQTKIYGGVRIKF